MRWTKRDDEPEQAQANNGLADKLSARRQSLPFRFELGWSGMFGLIMACFCLFLWMFLLGLWAGQTILLPPREGARVPATRSSQVTDSEAHTLSPGPKANSKHGE